MIIGRYIQYTHCKYNFILENKIKPLLYCVFKFLFRLFRTYLPFQVFFTKKKKQFSKN